MHFISLVFFTQILKKKDFYSQCDKSNIFVFQPGATDIRFEKFFSGLGKYLGSVIIMMMTVIKIFYAVSFT